MSIIFQIESFNYTVIVINYIIAIIIELDPAFNPTLQWKLICLGVEIVFMDNSEYSYLFVCKRVGNWVCRLIEEISQFKSLSEYWKCRLIS